jgi:SAM-dependent methyltransferase
VSSISDRLAVTAAAYDAVSVRYAELVRGELDALPLDRAVLAAFADHVRAEGGGLVADLGCGEGRIGAHLAGLGLDVTGIDMSPALIEIARATRAELPPRPPADAQAVTGRPEAPAAGLTAGSGDARLGLPVRFLGCGLSTSRSWSMTMTGPSSSSPARSDSSSQKTPRR